MDFHENSPLELWFVWGASHPHHPAGGSFPARSTSGRPGNKLGPDDVGDTPQNAPRPVQYLKPKLPGIQKCMEAVRGQPEASDPGGAYNNYQCLLNTGSLNVAGIN